MANALDIATGLDRLPPAEKLRDGKGSGTGQQETPPNRKKEKKDSENADPPSGGETAEEGAPGKILDILI